MENPQNTDLENSNPQNLEPTNENQNRPIWDT